MVVMPLSTGAPLRTREAAEYVLRDFQETGAPLGLIRAAMDTVEELRRLEPTSPNAECS